MTSPDYVDADTRASAAPKRTIDLGPRMIDSTGDTSGALYNVRAVAAVKDKDVRTARRNWSSARRQREAANQIAAATPALTPARCDDVASSADKHDATRGHHGTGPTEALEAVWMFAAESRLVKTSVVLFSGKGAGPISGPRGCHQRGKRACEGIEAIPVRAPGSPRPKRSSCVATVLENYSGSSRACLQPTPSSPDRY